MISNDEIKQFNVEFKELEKNIRAYDVIIIYRHQSPDFDAMGSQMGLYTWIKDNFPNKEVHFVGDRHPDLMPDLFPYPETLDDSVYSKKHLAITCDISNVSRLADNHIDRADKVIKIDHHPLPVQESERYGDYLIVHPDRPAASELVALFALSRGKKYFISKEAASFLYSGIVGDTGRFSYQDTDGATFRVAGDLVDRGADVSDISFRMYQLDQRQINILKECLNHYQVTEKGTCYYVFTKEQMEQLHMTVDHGNLHINTFRNMKGVRVAVSVTWDEGKNHYRVSLRSAHVHVAPAAVAFGGGGHDFAAGCHIDSLDELPKLIQAIDELK